MSTQHTPGTWVIYKVDDSTLVLVLDDQGKPSKKICRCGGISEEANARLIAAAPELLQALEALIEIGKPDLSNPKYDSYFLTAREAIKKARQQ